MWRWVKFKCWLLGHGPWRHGYWSPERDEPGFRPCSYCERCHHVEMYWAP